jgi:hypothetical protein
LLVGGSGGAWAQTTGRLDSAIKAMSGAIAKSMEQGSILDIADITAPTPRLSEYITSELTKSLLAVGGGKLKIVDRRERERVQRELLLHESGLVSEETSKQLGHALGASVILTGSISNLSDDLWRLTFKVVTVEGMDVVAQPSKTFRADAHFKGLLPAYLTAVKPKPPITTGEKVGTGAMNIFLGLGSYLEGDIFGGLTLTAGYAVAAGLCVIEATALDWDSPAVGVPGTAGLTLAGLTLAYGFVRPFIYNNAKAVAVILDHTQIDIVPTKGVRLTWGVSF